VGNHTEGNITCVEANADNSEKRCKHVPKADTMVDVSRRLSSLEKEFQTLKRQMEGMKSEMEEMAKFQKKMPTVPQHRHEELKEAIEKQKAIPTHAHPDMKEAISQLSSRYDDGLKAVRQILDEHKYRIDSLDLNKEDRKKKDTRSAAEVVFPWLHTGQK
jgi:regulator of replication initiation timing